MWGVVTSRYFLNLDIAQSPFCLFVVFKHESVFFALFSCYVVRGEFKSALNYCMYELSLTEGSLRNYP